MDKKSYEQRVWALAEKMAKDSYNRKIPPTTVGGKPIYYSWEDFKLKRAWIAEELPRSRIAVAEMAEAYEKGRAKGYELGVQWSEGHPITISPKFELIEQGLIPDEKEVSNDL